MQNLDQTYLKFSEKGVRGIAPFINNIDSKEDIIYNLLDLHIYKIDLITNLIKKQVNTYNEVFELLADYPTELKFCKQLFTHRKDPKMNLVFLYGISAFKPIVFPLLKTHFKITENQKHLNILWTTFVETWCSKLNTNNLSANNMNFISEEAGEILIKINIEK